MTPISRLIAAAAVGCFIGAVALTPSEVRSRLNPGIAAPDAIPAETVAPVAVVSPNGDPFVARADDDDDHTAPAVREPALPAALARIGPLPPNAGAFPFVWNGRPDEVVVRAVVVGPHPSALVDDGGTTHLLTVGDPVAGSSVVAIDAGGVVLGDRRRLHFPSAGISHP